MFLLKLIIAHTSDKLLDIAIKDLDIVIIIFFIFFALFEIPSVYLNLRSTIFRADLNSRTYRGSRQLKLTKSDG